MEKQPIGSVVWRDLTVPDAAGVRDFYASVVGWEMRPHPMGEYDDYDVRSPESGDVVAGVCHARGENAKIPAQWLVYVVVASVEQSARRAAELGGAVLDGPRPLGKSAFCVIRDPAGAVLGLIENAD
jgi:predicted enzyme related to lactoylglutathione lyase